MLRYLIALALLPLVLMLGSNGLVLAQSKQPNIRAAHALVLNGQGKPLISKNADQATPIASITKLMTAMVVLDAGQPLDQILKITKADRDTLKNTSSRLRFGGRLSRGKMLTISLSSSENRAAHALARHYPGGVKGFVQAMNQKAEALGMSHTRFADPTGLSPNNISTANDLAKLVQAAMDYPLIRRATTSTYNQVYPFKNRGPLEYRVTNRFLRNDNPNWEVLLSKTGYIREAGRCLVMRARTAGQDLTIILLKAQGKLTPYGDSNRIRKWLLQGNSQVAWQH
ncbi:MAG: serine hydrolase [Gammaproteobacteria bacterium SHHR-1]|uniref:serine hydrolase n=1 Tax=Magnetovirga frankeli TaxID=947516 RepID=UPI001293E2F0|nr:serine hydrolase [gamma proteobacterium SS-5]